MVCYVSDVSDGSPDLVAIAPQVWSHIALTFDGATGKTKFYLNVTVVDSGSIAAALGASDELPRIGGASAVDDSAWATDQVALFSRTLAPSEAAAVATLD